MRSLRIKVCGMREPQNISDIAGLQPDMLGFIFYPKSSRWVGQLSPQSVRQLVNIGKIGVFVDADLDTIVKAIQLYGLDGVQLHGSEPPTLCAEIQDRVPTCYVCKAFGIDRTFHFEDIAAYTKVCSYFLFDTKVPTHGGAGFTFDWSLLQAYKEKTPFYLAGGIGLEEIPAIKDFFVREHRLLGIDINSRVEDRPGLKSTQLVSQIIQELKR